MIQPAPTLQELTLTLTGQCNLHCSYCYVPAGRHDRMADEVIDEALRLFARHARRQGPLALSFFGGEPFLARDAMSRAVTTARGMLGDAPLRVLTPTNGLLLDDDTLALCASLGISIALSIDGVTDGAERRDAAGRGVAAPLLERAASLLAVSWPSPVIARMTVTPLNVDHLARNVRALARIGFTKIFYLPDVDQPWGADALAIWRREHERIGTWLVGAWGAGVRIPDLPAWRSIENRLLSGKPKRPCGAGERLAAVTTDGHLVPCYRFAFEQGDGHVLGNVHDGFTRSEARARFADLDPERLRPQEGSCRSCSSRDGCTHFCPAQGWLSCGDPLGVPAVTCNLMRAQVEVIRTFAAGRTRPRPVHRPAWAAAAMVAAMAAVGVSACGGNVSGDGATVGDAGVDQQTTDGEGPGVCPAQVDASNDQYGPGQCPIQVDASDDQYGPGLCPIQVDASDDQYGPGQCPIQVDASDDQYGPGLCPIQVDASEDVMGGGICK